MPGAEATTSSAPRTAGSIASALRTAPIATGRSKLIVNPVLTAATLPDNAVAAMRTVVASRVEEDGSGGLGHRPAARAEGAGTDRDRVVGAGLPA